MDRGIGYKRIMSIERNKEIARRFVEEVFGGRPEAVDELVAEDFVPHSWGPMPPGREPLKAAQARVAAGVSDGGMEIQDMIAEGDRVAIRLVSRGTHTGTFLGIPATGRSYAVPEIHIVRIRDGQVVEHWREMNVMDLMQQLGAGPGTSAGH